MANMLDLSAAFWDQVHEAQRLAPGARQAGVVGTGNFLRKVESDALAVHPDQIPEAIAAAKALGVAAPEFLPDGRPVFDNSAHFRRYAKAHGFRHRGY